MDNFYLLLSVSLILTGISIYIIASIFYVLYRYDSAKKKQDALSQKMDDYKQYLKSHDFIDYVDFLINRDNNND